MKIRLSLTIIAALLYATYAQARDFVVIAKEAKVFEKPNTKAYATTNREGNDVNLSSGQAFECLETKDGWHKIVYSPGLKGYILDLMCAPASSLKMPQPGSYKVGNDAADTLKAVKNAAGWTASSTKHPVQLRGEVFGNVIVFAASDGVPVYSLTVLSGKPVAMAYDNSITKYF